MHAPTPTNRPRVLALAGLLTYALAISAIAQASNTPILTFSSNPPSLALQQPTGEPIHGVELIPHGLARLDRTGALLVRGGEYTVEGAGEPCAQAVTSPNGFTLEIVVAFGANDGNQHGSLLNLGIPAESPILGITQSGVSVRAVISGSTRSEPTSLSLGTVAPDHPIHMAIVFDGKEFRSFSNGTLSDARPFAPADTAQRATQLTLGNRNSGPDARIFQLILRRETLSHDEIRKNADAALARVSSAPPVETLLVAATLTAKSPVPSLDRLAPYTQSLAVYEYTVDNLLSGQYASKRLYVAHWTVLDTTRLPFADVPIGGRYVLHFEPFDAQPQLKSENLNDAVIDDFDLPLYYDIGGTSLGFDVSPTIDAPNPPLAQGPLQTTSAASGTFPAEQQNEVVRQAQLAEIALAKARLDSQVSELGGYPTWLESLGVWRGAIRKLSGRGSLIKIPNPKKIAPMNAGVAYLLDESLADMPSGDSPLDVIIAFHQLLAKQGIDLLFVPIPPRDEVYPESLSPTCPPHRRVSPQTTQFLQALLDADVEVVDLRESFLDERKNRRESIYTLSDVHWSAYGVRRAATDVASRVRRYFVAAEGQPRYSEKQIQVVDSGSLTAVLDPDAHAAMPASEWDVFQVLNADGTPYRDVDTSPVVVAGDSYVLRYNEHAGHFSAHLAKELGFPVSMTAKNGDAPQALRTILNQDPDNRAGRRIVVWMVSLACLSDRLPELWQMPRSPQGPN